MKNQFPIPPDLPKPIDISDPSNISNELLLTILQTLEEIKSILDSKL